MLISIDRQKLIKDWKGELFEECIQRRRLLFIPTFRKLSKGTPFRYRNKLRQNIAAIIKKKRTKKNKGIDDN